MYNNAFNSITREHIARGLYTLNNISAIQEARLVCLKSYKLTNKKSFKLLDLLY